MTARKKVVGKSAARGSRKKVSSAAGKSKKSAAKAKVSKKTLTKKSTKKPKAASSKKSSAAKVSKKKAPQKSASKVKPSKTAAKGPAKTQIATRTSIKGASKKVSDNKSTAKAAGARKAVPTPTGTSHKGTGKLAKAANQAVKRKIAISVPAIKRPTRVSAMAPLNPVDLLPSRPKRRKKATDDQLIHGIPPYQPKKDEPYMSDAQLDHFRKILTAWKAELMQEVDRTVHHMQDEASNFPDPNDRATQESEFGLELRTRDRERKLLKKIEQALVRIENGSYGFCEETGDEIGLKRLEARPVATLSVEAQERREVAERLYRDQEDR